MTNHLNNWTQQAAVKFIRYHGIDAWIGHDGRLYAGDVSVCADGTIQVDYIPLHWDQDTILQWLGY